MFVFVTGNNLLRTQQIVARKFLEVDSSIFIFLRHVSITG